MTELGDNGNGRITLAVLQETVRNQGEETRRTIDALMRKLDATCESISRDHDTLVKLQGTLDTEVSKADGTHSRIFAITDSLGDRVDKLDGRDKWGTFGVLVAAVIASVLSAVLGK
jgi:hypothetical protein